MGLGLEETEELNFTCSFELVEYAKSYDSLNQLISLADKALYRSKDKGGNIVTEHFETIVK